MDKADIAYKDNLNETQRQACEKLKSNPTITTLWQAVLAFENYPLKTISGLEFTYEFKKNRRGSPGNELQISRKSKTIIRSSVEKALAVVMERGEPFPVQMSFPIRMSTPKELGVFGASYIYPLFVKFGLVEHIGSNRRGGRRKKDSG